MLIPARVARTWSICWWSASRRAEQRSVAELGVADHSQQRLRQVVVDMGVHAQQDVPQRRQQVPYHFRGERRRPRARHFPAVQARLPAHPGISAANADGPPLHPGRIQEPALREFGQQRPGWCAGTWRGRSGAGPGAPGPPRPPPPCAGSASPSAGKPASSRSSPCLRACMTGSGYGGDGARASYLRGRRRGPRTPCSGSFTQQVVAFTALQATSAPGPPRMLGAGLESSRVVRAERPVCSPSGDPHRRRRRGDSVGDHDQRALALRRAPREGEPG